MVLAKAVLKTMQLIPHHDIDLYQKEKKMLISSKELQNCSCLVELVCKNASNRMTARAIWQNSK